MAAARSAGLDRFPVIAAVAVFTDVVSAAVLQGLPGLELDRALVDGAWSPPPIRWKQASRPRSPKPRALLSIDGVDGVNVSGLASGAGTRIGAEIKAEVGNAYPGGRWPMSEAMSAEFDTVAEWTAQMAARTRTRLLHTGRVSGQR